MDRAKREQFGERLKELRNRRGMSQRDAAARIGITASELSKYEKGNRNPGVQALAMILNAYEVTEAEADEIRGEAGYDLDLSGLLEELRTLADDETLEIALKNELGHMMQDLVVSFNEKRNGKPEWVAIPIAGRHANELALDHVEAMVDKAISEAMECGLNQFVLVIRESQHTLLTHLKDKFKRLNLRQAVQTHDGLIGAIHAIYREIGKRPVVLMFPDDRMRAGCLNELLNQFAKHRCCMLSLRQTGGPNEEAAGMVTKAEPIEDDEVYEVLSLEEKKSASGLFWILGRYVLTDEIYRVIDECVKLESTSSTELTDALCVIAKDRRVKGCVYRGEWKSFAPYRREMWNHLDEFLRDDDTSWRTHNG